VSLLGVTNDNRVLRPFMNCDLIVKILYRYCKDIVLTHFIVVIVVIVTPQWSPQ
jgi:hypothetical protein